MADQSPKTVDELEVQFDPDIKPFRSILVIALWIGGAIFILSLLFPLLLKAREAARESASRNNLKQIGLALHNYHDVHQVLPPGGSIREDGTPHHGWMTSILPYLDASPVFSMLDFDEAWDHPFNEILSFNSNPNYLNPSHAQSTDQSIYPLTHYLGNPALLNRNSAVDFATMERGTSHHWMVGEIAGGFQPAAYPFNWRAWNGLTNSSPTGYGLTSKNVTQFLIADGSVKKVAKQAAKEFWEDHSDNEVDINQPRYSVPPVTFPIDMQSYSLRETSSDNASITVVAVKEKDTLQLRFRILPWEKGNYDANLTSANIEFAAKEFPGATQVTIPERLDSEHLTALKEFKSLQMIKAYQIQFDNRAIAAIQSLSKLESIYLNKISDEDYQRLIQELPDLRIEYDLLRD